MTIQKLGVFGTTKDEETITNELREFFMAKGVKLPEIKSSELFANVKLFSEASEKLASSLNEKDTEMIMNAIFNLSITLDVDQSRQFVELLCRIFKSPTFSKGSGWNSHAGVAVRILSSLFHLYVDRPEIQLIAFKTMLEIAGTAGITKFVDVSLPTVEQYINDWHLDMEDGQKSSELKTTLMLRGWTRIWNDEETRLSYNRPSKQMKLFQIFCCDEIRVGVFPGIGGNIFVPALDEIKNISSYRRDLLRKLHSSLITDNRTNLAFEVMMALLRTYTQVDAEKAKEDARECVRTAIADPNSFSVDHLLRLSAVQSLAESDPKIHKLLMLFSKGKLADYRRFIAENSSFVKDQLRADEAALEKKFKNLTLISLAEQQQSLSLKALSKELEISDPEELEEFLIDAIRIGAVNGKINEQRDEFVVSSFQYRTFERPQWELLQKRLSSLLRNFKHSAENLQKLVTEGNSE